MPRKIVVRSTRNRTLRIISRASTLASVFSFILGLFGVSITIILSTAIVMAATALTLSFLIEYSPETVNCFIKTMQGINPEAFGPDDLEILYSLRSELLSLIASTEASVSASYVASTIGTGPYSA
ncbi:MAG: hypothetical protein JKY54_06795 [Flavobacteriales bacterium]|nr:hypothetical protein [Flavobacteriales bacterium]